MTPETITAIAREYAEEENPIESYGDNMFERGMDLSISRGEAERVLTWLTRRFCLVEKCKVEEEYKRALETNRKGKETCAHSLCTMGSARKVLLESLFPDLGKEVEE